MKQSMTFFLASILLLLSACQYKEQTNTPIVESGKQSNSSASTETKGTKTEKNMIETGSDTLAFASEILTDDALYTFDFGVKSRFNTPFYPCGMNDLYSSTVSLCQKSTSFPDTLDSFDEKFRRRTPLARHDPGHDAGHGRAAPEGDDLRLPWY